MVRAKGFFWVASLFDHAFMLSQAGQLCTFDAAGYFWAAIPKKQWMLDPEAKKDVLKLWKEPYGDRRQELVIIGRKMNQEKIKKELETCLLTNEELEKGKEFWANIPDPFYEQILQKELVHN